MSIEWFGEVEAEDYAKLRARVFRKIEREQQRLEYRAEVAEGWLHAIASPQGVSLETLQRLDKAY